MDFIGIRKYIIDHLAQMLDNRYYYHSLEHTLQVEKAVIQFAKMENLAENNITLLRTAALFHDSGYIVKYKNNETHGVANFKKVAKKFDYSNNDIIIIERLIMVTARGKKPTSILEELICDADHDYIGTNNYHKIAKYLRNELAIFGESLTDKEWLIKQIDYLELEHHYYSLTAKKKRQEGKEKRINELKSSLSLLDLKE